MTEELIERLELDECSRKLDGDVYRHLFPDDLLMTDSGSVGPVPREAKREPLRDVPDISGEVIADLLGLERFTASLDAAVGLAEHATPGKFWWLFSRAMHAITSARLGAVSSVQPGELARAFVAEVLKEHARGAKP
jgi:hypothetical protein